MDMSPDEFRRLTNLSADIADGANLLLDIAEQEQDEQLARRLLERAREFMAISGIMTDNLDRIARRDDPRGRGLVDREPSLRQVIERAYAQHAKTGV